MCKYLVSLLCLSGLFYKAQSQPGDTIYFDKAWHVCKKQEAKYYRLIEQANGLYQIRDYFMSGVLQMYAQAVSLSPEIFEGPCCFYRPNGKLSSCGEYKKGKQVGIWKYYNGRGKLAYTFDFTQENELNKVPEKTYKKAMSENDNQFSFALRAKVFGFFIIEDAYFSTATLGVECLFKGRHSLGIDYTYFGWQFESDDLNDMPLYETYERRGYVYFDYRYKLLARKDNDFYFNLYDKIGTYHMWLEGVAEGYSPFEKPFLSDKTDGTFNQIGVGLGFKRYLGERFYFDLSANGGKVFTNYNSVRYN